MRISVIQKGKAIAKVIAVEDFYGPGIEIWAGFGAVSITEKKRFGSIMSNFLGQFFQVFMDKKKKVKTFNVRTKKLHKLKLKINLKKLKRYFFEKNL